MYYVYRKKYNQPGKNLIDNDIVVISTEPFSCAGQTVIESGEVVHSGDYVITAIGYYKDIVSSRDAIWNKFGACRRVDRDGTYNVEVYLIEEFIKLHHNPILFGRVICNFASKITENTTDKQLSKIVSESEKILNGLGYSLYSDGIEFALDMRQRYKDVKETIESLRYVELDKNYMPSPILDTFYYRENKNIEYT